VEDGIYLIPAGTPAIEFFSFATDEMKTAVTLVRERGYGLSVSLDGESILYPLFDSDNADLMLVENFR